jgi:hypothetical protein
LKEEIDVSERFEEPKNRNNTLLKTEATANRLNVSPRTLEKWRLSGSGPLYIKMGSLVYYAEADIENWLVRQKRRSTSDSGNAV